MREEWKEKRERERNSEEIERETDRQTDRKGRTKDKYMVRKTDMERYREREKEQKEKRDLFRSDVIIIFCPNIAVAVAASSLSTLKLLP